MPMIYSSDCTTSCNNTLAIKQSDPVNQVSKRETQTNKVYVSHLGNRESHSPAWVITPVNLLTFLGIPISLIQTVPRVLLKSREKKKEKN